MDVDYLKMTSAVTGATTCFAGPLVLRAPLSSTPQRRYNFICCTAAAASAADQNGPPHQPGQGSPAQTDSSSGEKRRILSLNVKTAAEYSLWHSREFGLHKKKQKFVEAATELLDFGQTIGLILIGVVGGVTATTASLAVSPTALAFRPNLLSASSAPALLGISVASLLFLALQRQVTRLNVALRELVLTEGKVSSSSGRNPEVHRHRPRRIILVRHGESWGNVDKEVYRNIPDHSLGLTPTGEKQSHSAGAKLRNVLGKRPGRIGFYVSPYTRTTETLRFMLEGGKFNKESQIIRQEVLLREQQFGNFQDPAKAGYFAEERARMGWFWHRMPGGENSADVYARAMLFLDSMFRDLDNAEHAPLDEVVIVSHGLTIRMLLMRMFHWTVDETLKVTGPTNGEMWILERMPGSDRYELVNDLYECNRVPIANTRQSPN